jgi:hypothetical protein
MWALNHGGGLVYFTLPKFYLLVEVKSPVCEQKDPHTDATADLTQNPLNESPISYPETTRSYLLC